MRADMLVMLLALVPKLAGMEQTQALMWDQLEQALGLTTTRWAQEPILFRRGLGSPVMDAIAAGLITAAIFLSGRYFALARFSARGVGIVWDQVLACLQHLRYSFAEVSPKEAWKS
jgi:hypothetical protein